MLLFELFFCITQFFKTTVLCGEGRAHTFIPQIPEGLLILKKVSCPLEWRGARTANCHVLSQLLGLKILPPLWQRW